LCGNRGAGQRQKTVPQIRVFTALVSGRVLERQIWLEKRLLVDLQSEILKPEALEYTIA
jgi:hypothetical protein